MNDFSYKQSPQVPQIVVGPVHSLSFIAQHQNQESATKQQRSISQQPVRLHVQPLQEETRFSLTQQSTKKSFQGETPQVIQWATSSVKEIDSKALNDLFQQRLLSQEKQQQFQLSERYQVPLQVQSPQRVQHSPRIVHQSMESNLNLIYEQSLADMQMKITILITENERLIQINEGLMRENESLKINEKTNFKSIENTQITISKVKELTEANSQLRAMISQFEQKMAQQKQIYEGKIETLLGENENLNRILQDRIKASEQVCSEIERIKQDTINYNEEKQLLSEKVNTLEQQKKILEKQINDYEIEINNEKETHSKQINCLQNNIQENQQQQKYEQIIQQLQQQVVNQSYSLTNLDVNYQLQLQELHSNFQKELEEQKQTFELMHRQKLEKVMAQIHQELTQTTMRENKLIEELNRKQQEWMIERERLINLINHLQNRLETSTHQFQNALKELETKNIQPISFRGNVKPDSNLSTQPQSTIRVQSCKDETNRSSDQSDHSLRHIITTKENDEISVTNIRLKTQEPVQVKQDQNTPLSVLALNTFKKSQVSYDRSYYKSSSDLYMKYLKGESRLENTPAFLDENSKINNQIQENCKKLLQGTQRTRDQ